MKITPTLLLTLSATVPVALLAHSSVVFASTDGGSHGSIADTGKYWVNFGIYLFVLWLALRNVVPSAWRARRTRIKDSVLAATKDLEAAEVLVAETEKRTRSLAADQRKAKQEIVTQAESEAALIIASAKERAVRQRSQAEDLVKGEGRSAEVQYRAELVAKALQLAKDSFQRGDFATKESDYRSAALERARRLIQ